MTKIDMVSLCAAMLTLAFVPGHVLAQPATQPATLPATLPAEGTWLAPVVDVPRLEGIVIDGDAADWADRGLAVAMPADQFGRTRPAANLDVHARLGWNAEGLCVLVVIRDDVPLEAEDIADVWKFDSIELFVADHRGSANFYQLLVSPGADPKHPAERHRIHDRRTGEENAAVQCSVGARTRKLDTGAESTVEILLPWSNLGPAMAAGAEPAVQIMVNDLDSDKEPKFRALWYPVEGTDHDTFKMVPLRLAQRRARPGVGATWLRGQSGSPDRLGVRFPHWPAVQAPPGRPGIGRGSLPGP